MVSPERFKVLCFGGAVDFHVPLQIYFVTKTARTKRAFDEVIIVAFLRVFLVHYYTLFLRLM